MTILLYRARVATITSGTAAKNVTITAGTGSDTVSLASIANNNVIIYNTGDGNDKIYCFNGNDTLSIIGGSGNDKLYGFDSKDTLTFDNLDFKASYNSKNQAITLKVSGGSVTLKDFTATTFHVDDDTYKISGSTLKKQ